MRLKFPLYGQILLWFFLNLTLVAAALYVVCTVIFGMDVRSLVSDGVEMRMVAAGREVSASLRESPRDEWEDVVARYAKEYGVEFVLYHPDGAQRYTGSRDLPASLEEKMQEEHLRPPPNERGGGPGRRGVELDQNPRGGPIGRGRERRGPPPPRWEGDDRGAQSRGGEPQLRTPGSAPRPRMLFFERTGEERLYWAGVWVPLFNSEYRHPIDGVLVANASSLRGNEIFVDWRPWLWALLAVLGVSALIWLPFVHGLTRRLRRLTSLAEAISEGEFEVAATSRRSDEIGRLSRAIRGMAIRLDAFVTGQKRFLGDTAHELCSPLARIRMNLGLLEREIQDGQRERLGALEGEVEELAQLVNELLAFSKASLNPASLTTEPVNLLNLVEELIEREGRDCVVQCAISPSLTGQVNREFAMRAIGNVLKNAVRYAGQAGPITISATRGEDSVELAIADEGPGIPEEWHERVLEPFARPDFARTREGGGVGLGFAISKTCIEALGGRIRLRNRKEKGLIVTLVFPSDMQNNETGMS